ncbi:MAG: D-amino acid aminotransferase [Planctomycetes bacterium]|nr:D-amino acid aminotransferase [Planctomycetota bacterium]
MGTVVLLNGEVLPAESARISVFDHGFLFGDSVYEVVRTRHGRPFELDAHLARLRRSAEQTYLEIPYTDGDLERELGRAISLAANQESYVRIIVTRGVGEIELHPATCGPPTLLLIVTPLRQPPDRFYREGIRLAIVGRRRMDPASLSPSAKTGNYLNNVLAIIEAKKRGADDAVMLNTEGFLTEGTTSNIFFVRDGVAYTPALQTGILSGITRGLVLRMLSAERIGAREGNYGPEELRGADEAFITSTTRDVMPVREVDAAPVGLSRPGPVTRRLMERFAAL